MTSKQRIITERSYIADKLARFGAEEDGVMVAESAARNAHAAWQRMSAALKMLLHCFTVEWMTRHIEGRTNYACIRCDERSIYEQSLTAWSTNGDVKNTS